MIFCLLGVYLIGFVGVGVIAGLVFGLYLIDVKNTNQLVFVEGPSLTDIDPSNYIRATPLSENLTFIGGPKVYVHL